MKITIQEKIPSTKEEIDSVNQNNRPTLSEELHNRGKRSSKYRARYDPGAEEFAIFGEQY